jgi:hypothetical protein
MQRKHPWVILVYSAFYVISFILLEQRDVEMHVIHCRLDDMIPFCEYFVVPYVLWYGFVAGTLCYFTLRQGREKEYWQLGETLVIGMTVFLVVSLVYPNGQRLRPVLEEGNCFVRLVRLLYRIDTPTNILPSMHVFNAVTCCVAICKDQTCRSHKRLLAATRVLTVLIVLSTMFMKQHSVVDVCLALALYGVCYQLVYIVLPQYRRRAEGRDVGLGHYAA